MRKAILSLVALALTACAPAYVSVYDGNPCNQFYFDAMACQQAIHVGGWYVGGVLHTHYFGGYGYDYYYRQNRVYIQHGGRVTPYRQAIGSVNSGGKYVPPSQTPNRTPGQRVGSVNAGKPYTPPSQSSPRTYTPPASRPSAPYRSPASSSRSYSAPRSRR